MSHHKELHDLWDDYLNLCEKYEDKLPINEFGFAIIRFTSKMLFDTTPSVGAAYRTILAGMEEGNKWSMEQEAND